MLSQLSMIALHGVPRSGTTWIGEILNSSPHTLYRYQPLFSYAFRDLLTPASSEKEILGFFHDLVDTEDPFVLQNQKSAQGLLPVFDKREPAAIIYKEVRFHHILWNLMRRTQQVKLVAVVRSPLAVISSWLQAPREFRKDLGWVEADEWRYALKKNLNKPEEFNGFEKWKEAANIFLRLRDRYPDRVHLLEYRRLLEDTDSTTEGLFGFCGLALTDQTRQFLQESRSRTTDHAYAVYRDYWTDDAWRHSLDPGVVRQVVADVQGTELRQFLYLTDEETGQYLEPAREAALESQR